MADLVEILVGEHLAIKRVKLECEAERNIGKFKDFHEYLIECHVQVEENVVFPLLSDYGWEDSDEFVKRIERIAADHRLIEKLGSNLIEWEKEGNMQLFNQRFPMYFQLLLDHNASEEDSIFNRWTEIDVKETESARKEAIGIISNFGIERYSSVTGLRKSSLDYIFR